MARPSLRLVIILSALSLSSALRLLGLQLDLIGVSVRPQES